MIKYKWNIVELKINELSLTKKKWIFSDKTNIVITEKFYKACNWNIQDIKYLAKAIIKNLNNNNSLAFQVFNINNHIWYIYDDWDVITLFADVEINDFKKNLN